MKLCRCREIAGAEDLAHALAIRRRVFVEEQNLFVWSDWDEHDLEAIHLVAEVAGRIVGTVRLYAEEGDVWVGGRLAVLPEYREGVGSALVRRAVAEAEERQARAFIAWVQEQNRGFFVRLGWRAIGETVLKYGREHVFMEAPLMGAGVPANGRWHCPAEAE